MTLPLSNWGLRICLNPRTRSNWVPGRPGARAAGCKGRPPQTPCGQTVCTSNRLDFKTNSQSHSIADDGRRPAPAAAGTIEASTEVREFLVGGYRQPASWVRFLVAGNCSTALFNRRKEPRCVGSGGLGRV